MNEKGFRCGGFRVIGRMLAGIIAVTALSLVIGALVMVLWNWLMPGIFGLGTIGYWQGFGITLLAKLLLGGFGKHAPWSPRHRWQEKRWREFAHSKGFNAMGRLDDMYEDWWESEGSESFKSYMKNKAEKKEE